MNQELKEVVAAAVEVDALEENSFLLRITFHLIFTPFLLVSKDFCDILRTITDFLSPSSIRLQELTFILPLTQLGLSAEILRFLPKEV
jgi:hypothetical protein